MKCQRRPRSAHSARLSRGLRVAVLADVGDAEVGQDPHVGGGEELGDGHERHLVGVASGGAAAVGDPAAYDVEAGRELVAARGRRPSRRS